MRLTSTALFPSGDEPHYLVIAQSLWRDGDLKIENNHQRGDYREYFEPDLEPHYLTRGTDGEIYSDPSDRNIGTADADLRHRRVPGGRRGADPDGGDHAAAIAWRWTIATLNAAGAATFAWAAIALTRRRISSTRSRCIRKSPPAWR